MPWTPPTSAESISIRPLDKGIRLDGSSLMVPDASMLECDNFISNLEGYRKRPGYVEFGGGSTVPYRPVDVLTTRDDTGAEATLLLTTHCLYKVDSRTGYTEVPWAYTTGTVTVADDLVTGAGTLWADNDVLPGDLIRIGTEEATIISAANTSITIASGSLTDGSGLSYSVQRTFTPGRLNVPTWVKTPDGIAIADGKHSLLWYDVTAETISFWTTDSGKYPPLGDTICAVVGYDGKRVFIGNVYDSDGDGSSKILWSGLADNHDFNFPENFQAFPQFTGDLRRILSIQDKNMLYFTDGIMVGLPTNYPTAPYRYVPLETGPLGLVGSYAVTPYLGGHFFISQNGFYFTDGTSFQEISQPIAVKLGEASLSPEWSYVCPDTQNFTIMFGLSNSDDVINRIYRMDPRSKSWSCDIYSTKMITNPVVNATIAWSDLSGTWNALGSTYASWDAMRIRDVQRRVIIENNSQLWRGSFDSGVDFGSSAVNALLMTKDHDLNAPDGNKIIVRLGIKISTDLSRLQPMTFQILGSTNRGRNWKSLGDLFIPLDRDEGYLNFRMIGSSFRFILHSNSQDIPYFISEYTLRLRGGGEELDTSTHA